MEPFPFDSENFNECMIELYKSFFSWLWSMLSKPFTKKRKTPEHNSSIRKDKAEAGKSAVMEEEYNELV